jgi:hypothetical protein
MELVMPDKLGTNIGEITFLGMKGSDLERERWAIAMWLKFQR